MPDHEDPTEDPVVDDPEDDDVVLDPDAEPEDGLDEDEDGDEQ